MVSQTRGLSICHTVDSVNANMHNTRVFCFEQAIMVQMLWRLEADNAKYEQNDNRAWSVTQPECINLDQPVTKQTTAI